MAAFGVKVPYEEILIKGSGPEMINILIWCCENLTRSTWGTIPRKELSENGSVTLDRMMKEPHRVLAAAGSLNWIGDYEDYQYMKNNTCRPPDHPFTHVLDLRTSSDLYAGIFISTNLDEAMLFKLTWGGE